MRRLLWLALVAGCTQILGVGSFHETGGDGGVPGDGQSHDSGGSGSCLDEDGDGFTTCDGDCCDNTSECPNPALVNPGAYDVPGDGIDNDCDGSIDDVSPCDSAVAGMSDAASFAKAIDICRTTTAGSARWGLISAAWSKTDGTGTPNDYQDSIMTEFGTDLEPTTGESLGVMSTGHADTVTNPQTDNEPLDDVAPYPMDFASAHGGTVPTAPGCPMLSGTDALDPAMLTLQIKVPTNASSFGLKANFYSADFPVYVCSAFNDYFVVLLDSSYAGTPANPSDKNLAFYTPDLGVTKYPVGVNLAEAGQFKQCQNGPMACGGSGMTEITTCTGELDLGGTSYGVVGSGSGCGSSGDVLDGGASGWLEITGNVEPGEIMTLRLAIWNSGDPTYQSLVVLDGFAWSGSVAQPGARVVSAGFDETGSFSR